MIQKNIKFIPYGNINVSKKILDKYKKNINCVLLEPIQGSLPIKILNTKILKNINKIKFCFFR